MYVSMLKWQYYWFNQWKYFNKTENFLPISYFKTQIKIIIICNMKLNCFQNKRMKNYLEFHNIQDDIWSDLEWWTFERVWRCFSQKPILWGMSLYLLFSEVVIEHCHLNIHINEKKKWEKQKKWIFEYI